MLRRTLGALALAATLPLVACDDGTGVGEHGTLSLLLTDAPGDFQQAIVTIERVELVGSGQPLVLRDAPVTTDLLTLANDVATLVEDAIVPTGTYTQLRFIIPEACIVVEQEDGSGKVFASPGFEACGTADGELQLPSFAQTGIKVNLPGGAVEVMGGQKILLVDFDVSQSFGQVAGQSEMWVMEPVINAEDVTLTGSIVVELTAADTVELPVIDGEQRTLADFQARLTGDAVPQPFEDADEDGVFTANFLFLIPDMAYEVSVELRDGVSYNFTVDPESPESVTLPSGHELTVDFEVTSASGS